VAARAHPPPPAPPPGAARRPKNVHILNGNAADLQSECDSYEKKIADYNGIELFLGGIGADGHIAFNEPGSSLVSRTRVKTLNQDTIAQNSRFFGGDVSKVPKMALTVGVGTVMDAREVLVIVTGQNKANALYKCIEEGVSHMWTVSMLQFHQRACIVCDDDATLELKVKTVKYFKEIQEQQEAAGIRPSGYQGVGQSDQRSRGGSTSSGGALITGSPLPTLPAGVPGGLHNDSMGNLFLPK
jgi:hypothetical protein